MAVVPDGRPSATGYRVRERFTDWTLLELDLITGRTHQIRVHLDAIGHPVAGDPVYGTGTSRKGPEGLERLFLHAWRLELASPSTSKLVRVEAPLPARARGGARGLRAAEASAGAGPAGGIVTDRGRRSRARPGAQLVIISGPSGRGQGHDHRRPPRAAPGPGLPLRRDLHHRAPRPGEVPGVSYQFLTPERVHAAPRCRRAARGQRGPRQLVRDAAPQVRQALAAGHDVILKIDVQGAQVVKERVSDALLVFVVPPSLEALFQRLRSRATETADELEIRQRNAAIELARQDDYDHVVVNETGQVERTAAEIEAIIVQEKRRNAGRRVRIS